MNQHKIDSSVSSSREKIKERDQELRRNLKPFKDLESDFKAWEDYILAHQSVNVFDELFKIICAKLTDERINLKDESSPCQFRAGTEEPEDGVIARIQGLLEEGINRWGILQAGERIELLPKILKHITLHLQWYYLLKTPKDVLGVAFEYLVTRVLKGEKGQFFTSRTVVEMMGKMVKMSWDKKVLDPACGSGGFLLWVLENVRAEIEAQIKDPRRAAKEEKEYANLRLFGLDYEPKMVKIAQVNMLMQEDSRTNIFVEDSLKDETWNPLAQRFIQRGTIDVILTNPPFAGDIKDPSVLQRYVLAHKNNGQLLKKQVRHLLFLEMCLNYLRPGGVLAIVLPIGVFNNPSLKHVRDFIRGQAQILACISLDPYVFAPHAGNRTGVLMLKKKERRLEELVPFKVFMAISKKSGKKQGGRPLYRTTPEGKLIYEEQGRPILDSDLKEIAEAYLTETIPSQLSDRCFWIRSTDIEDRIDPEYYRSINKEFLKKAQWEEVTLRPLHHFAEYVKRTINPAKNPSQSFRYIELDDINELGTIKRTQSFLGKDAPSRAGLLIKEGDIVTAMSGSQTGSPIYHRIAIITKEYDNCVASTGFGILRPKEKVDLYYLYGLLRSPYVLAEMRRKLQGGGIPKISENDLLEILILAVPFEKQKEIGAIIRKGFQTLQEAQNHFASAQSMLGKLFKPSDLAGEE